MKILPPFLLSFALAGGACCAAAAAPPESQEWCEAASPCRELPASEYSFADLVRLARSGSPVVPLPSEAHNGPAVRVAAMQAPAPGQFSIGAVPEPRFWLLLSGFAAALWVARRRLEPSF